MVFPAHFPGKSPQPLVSKKKRESGRDGFSSLPVTGSQPHQADLRGYSQI